MIVNYLVDLKNLNKVDNNLIYNRKKGKYNVHCALFDRQIIYDCLKNKINDCIWENCGQYIYHLHKSFHHNDLQQYKNNI